MSRRRKIGEPTTAIRVGKSTWVELNLLKEPSEPFDTVINRLLKGGRRR